jgi:hypothetical protein
LLPDQADECCQPGDVIIARIPGGFMLGRVPEKHGPGPWWRYVGAVNTFEEALRLARGIVTGKLWYHTGGKTYLRIPLDPSEPLEFTLDQDGTPV